MKRLIPAVLSLTMVLTPLAGSAMAADKPADRQISAPVCTADHKVYVTYHDIDNEYIFQSDLVGDGVIYVPRSAYRMTAEDCAATMPEGYRFVKSNMIMPGIFWDDYAWVYVEKIPDPTEFTLRFLDADGQEADTVVAPVDGEAVAVPAELDGQPVEAWTAEVLDLTVSTTDTISGRTLLDSCSWDTESPVIDFIPTMAEFTGPESFDIKFLDPVSGAFITNENNEPVRNITAGESVKAPRIIWNNGLFDWKADCVDLTVTPGDPVEANELLDNYEWDEKIPTIIFSAVAVPDKLEPEVPAEPAIPAQPVLPDGFTVRFQLADGTLISQQEVDAWGFYTLVDIPAGYTWTSRDIGLTVTTGDYLSGQTLDLDYTWYELNPTVVFVAD